MREADAGSDAKQKPKNTSNSKNWYCYKYSALRHFLAHTPTFQPLPYNSYGLVVGQAPKASNVVLYSLNSNNWKGDN